MLSNQKLEERQSYRYNQIKRCWMPLDDRSNEGDFIQFEQLSVLFFGSVWMSTHKCRIDALLTEIVT